VTSYEKDDTIMLARTQPEGKSGKLMYFNCSYMSFKPKYQTTKLKNCKFLVLMTANFIEIYLMMVEVKHIHIQCNSLHPTSAHATNRYNRHIWKVPAEFQITQGIRFRLFNRKISWNASQKILSRRKRFGIILDLQKYQLMVPAALE